MANVNKKYLDEILKDEAWNRLWKESANVSSVREFKRALNRFLSASEQIIFEKRLLIILLLERGFSYRKIGGILDVHPDTISLVKRAFKKEKKKIVGGSSTRLRDSVKFKKFYLPAYKGSSRWADINKYQARRHNRK